jgi:AcrR family transcriptional regulator
VENDRSLVKQVVEMHESVTDPALVSALRLFWTKGAESAAYGEIVQATGLSRKALYARWPDKLALVDDTLALYRREVLAGMLEALETAGVAAFWDRLETVVAKPGWCGCYLIRTGAGTLRGEPTVRAQLEDYLAALQAGFGKALADAPLPVSPDLAARQCVALLVLISQRGAVEGNSPAVRALIAAGRRTCGL